MTAIFDQGIADFERQATLEVDIGGVVTPLELTNTDPQRVLTRDSAGNVVAVHLMIDALPAGGKVAVRFRSQQGAIVAPGCSVYVHLRLASDIFADFRPTHVANDAPSPFQVSPSHELRWQFALRSRAKGTAWPLRMVEPILRSAASGVEQRLTASADSRAPNTFTTQSDRLSPGSYDAELHLVLESGANLVLKLPRHVSCQDKAERVTVELKQRAGDQNEQASHHRGHPDFGELGDTTMSAAVESVFRSDGFDYPVAVEIGIDHLMDSQETTVKSTWIRATPNRFVLQPGQAQRVLLQLKIPARIEEELVDGPFHGTLRAVRTDSGISLPVVRYKPITGVPDDEPVDSLTLVLRRPSLAVDAPRCFRNALRQQNGRLTLPMQVSINQPFGRLVIVRATHSSLQPRAISAKVSAIFVDPRSKQVPSVRMVLRDTSQSTQEVATGASAEWEFLLEIDDDASLDRALGDLTLESTGLAPLHVNLEIVPRRPLLGRTIRFVLWCLTLVFVSLGCVWLVRLLFARRFRANKLITITPEKPLAGIITLKTTPRGGVSLVTERSIKYGHQSESKRIPLIENRLIPVALDSLRSSDPLLIEEATESGVDGWKIAIHQFLPDPPELHAEIVEAPLQAQRAATCLSRMVRCLAASCVCLGLAQFLFFPPVLSAAQWLFDLLTIA